MSIAHSERKHARLSASGSSRWIACPGSVAFEDRFPDTSSTYADEGEAAHELSELHLSNHLGEIDKGVYRKSLSKFKRENQYYSQVMEDYVQGYVDIVMERVNEARSRTADAVVLLEHELWFDEWVPEGFGTGDVVIIAEGELEVIDLKYGQGVPVSAENNSQLRLYGLGALDEFDMLYGIDTVRMTIIQPRLDSISTEELSSTELIQWAESIVRPAAVKASEGSKEYEAGDHCRFCKARSVCRTRAEQNLELAKHEFEDPAALSIEELAEIRKQIDQLVNWAGDVKDYMLEQAEKHGVKYPGWKLVEGRSNRVITDKAKAEEILIAAEYEEDQILKPRELLAMGQLEKLVGKKQFAELLGEVIAKPQGKPTLVEESDKRPELNSVASAQADFA